MLASNRLRHSLVPLVGVLGVALGACGPAEQATPLASSGSGGSASGTGGVGGAVAAGGAGAGAVGPGGGGGASGGSAGVGGTAGSASGASGTTGAGAGGVSGSAGDSGSSGSSGSGGNGGAAAGDGGTGPGGSSGAASGGSSGGAGSGGASGGAGSGGASGAGGKGGSPNLTSAMIVRGAGTPTAGDNVMLGVIRTHGFDPEIFGDADVQASDVMGMGLIVISSSAESSPLGTKLRDVPVPILCVENGQYRNQGMTGRSSSDWGAATGQTAVAVLSGAAALVGPSTGNVTISGSGDLGWGIPAATALKGATIVGNANQVVIFGYTTGSQMVGMAAPAKRAGFAIREAMAASLNDDGKALFDSVLTWVIAP